VNGIVSTARSTRDRQRRINATNGARQRPNAAEMNSSNGTGRRLLTSQRLTAAAGQRRAPSCISQTDAWNESAQFAAVLDGAQIAGPYSVTDGPCSGPGFHLHRRIRHGTAPPSTSGSLTTTGAARTTTDRNLYVGGITFNGRRLPGRRRRTPRAARGPRHRSQRREIVPQRRRDRRRMWAGRVEVVWRRHHADHIRRHRGETTAGSPARPADLIDCAGRHRYCLRRGDRQRHHQRGAGAGNLNGGSGNDVINGVAAALTSCPAATETIPSTGGRRYRRSVCGAGNDTFVAARRT